MKKTPLIATVVLAAGALVAVTILSPPASESKKAPVATARVSHACKLFTLTDATALLGRGTKPAKDNGAVDAHNDTTDISACRYQAGANSLTLFVRLPKNAEGAAYNKTVFGEDRPAGMQTVSGVGDAAFWHEAASQLNLLKGDTFYIIENQHGEPADSGDLNTSQATYNQLKSKL
jgi:hypothetical protein